MPLPGDVRVCEWRREVVNEEDGDRVMVGLGLTAGRGWALEAGPVEKEVARGLAGLFSPSLLFSKTVK